MIHGADGRGQMRSVGGAGCFNVRIVYKELVVEPVLLAVVQCRDACDAWLFISQTDQFACIGRQVESPFCNGKSVPRGGWDRGFVDDIAGFS